MSVDPTSATAIVPLRTGGKTRLSSALGEPERAALAGAMLADVAAALTGAGVGRVIVAAEGPAAIAAAETLRLEVVRDAPGGGGLDRALEHAARVIAPDTPLLVVAADLPRLRPLDVQRLLGAPAPIVVAPTADGGTGGLLRNPAGLMATAYGPDSARRHLGLAREAGQRAATVRTTGFDHDVDTVADLLALREAEAGPATASLLATLDLTGRAAS
jgi:2-phospho-L-lactate/phosphoenolpyruvate guanylyltransferase